MSSHGIYLRKRYRHEVFAAVAGAEGWAGVETHQVRARWACGKTVVVEHDNGRLQIQGWPPRSQEFRAEHNRITSLMDKAEHQLYGGRQHP